jgi:hypothetical protein
MWECVIWSSNLRAMKHIILCNITPNFTALHPRGSTLQALSVFLPVMLYAAPIDPFWTW